MFAMVLSVLLHGAAESWALSRTQLSRLDDDDDGRPKPRT